MKLSEMQFDHMMNVLSTIAVELEPLLEDEGLARIIMNLKRQENEPPADYGKRLSKQILVNLSLLSGKYRPALHRILGAFFECAPEEIGRKNVNEIAAQLKISLEDEVLHGFFPQLGLFRPSE